MRFPRVLNIYDTIQPIIVVAKIILLFFGSFDLQQRIIRKTLFNQFCFILMVLVDLHLMHISIRGNSGLLTMTDSNLLNVGYYGTLLLCYMFGLSLSSVIHIKGATISHLIDSFAIFDDEMLRLGFSVNHQRSHRYSVLVMCWILSIAACTLTCVFIFGSENSWLNLSAMYPNRWTMLASTRGVLGLHVFGSTFCLTLLFLKARYSLLNKAMEKYIRSMNRITHQQKQHRLINKFAEMHDRLCFTIELFNECYGFGAIIVILCCLSFTIFTIFGLIHAYAAGSDDTTIRVAVVNILFSGLCIVIILQLVVSSALINDECKTSSFVVHKIVGYVPFRNQLHRELHDFSQQLDHHTPKISCKMFDLDWTLLYTLSGTLGTYVIILIQFDLVNINQAIYAQRPSISQNTI